MTTGTMGKTMSIARDGSLDDSDSDHEGYVEAQIETVGMVGGGEDVDRDNNKGGRDDGDLEFGSNSDPDGDSNGDSDDDTDFDAEAIFAIVVWIGVGVVVVVIGLITVFSGRIVVVGVSNDEDIHSKHRFSKD